MFEVTIIGDKLVVEKFVAMEERVANARPAMRLVAGYLMEETTKRFDEQGPGWAPLTWEWEQRKLQHGWDPRILHKLGRLRDSVTKPRSRNMILKISPSSLVFGTRVPYARAMQVGSPAHNTPARPFIRISTENRIVIRKIIEEYIVAPWFGGAGVRTAPVTRAFAGAHVGRGAGGRFVSLKGGG